MSFSIDGNNIDNNIRPTNANNDKIRYFHRVIRVTHPITVHPHVTLLFRIKIGKIFIIHFLNKTLII